LKKSWISGHPRVVIGIVLVVCLGPFLNKAIHADDVLFVWTAEWIQKHPADFFGFKVNWWTSAIPMWVANYNPPLISYVLAGAAFLVLLAGPAVPGEEILSTLPVRAEKIDCGKYGGKHNLEQDEIEALMNRR